MSANMGRTQKGNSVSGGASLGGTAVRHPDRQANLPLLDGEEEGFVTQPSQTAQVTPHWVATWVDWHQRTTARKPFPSAYSVLMWVYSGSWACRPAQVCTWAMGRGPSIPDGPDCPTRCKLIRLDPCRASGGCPPGWGRSDGDEIDCLGILGCTRRGRWLAATAAGRECARRQDAGIPGHGPLGDTPRGTERMIWVAAFWFVLNQISRGTVSAP